MEAVANQRDNMNYFIKKGGAAITKKDWDTAVFSYNKALEYQPGNKKLNMLVKQVYAKAGQYYILVHAEGDLMFPGFKMTGSFDVNVNEEFALMTVSAKLALGVPVIGGSDMLSLLYMSADGVLKITGDGVAGNVTLTIDQSPQNPEDWDSVPFEEWATLLNLDITVTGRFDLLINTTRQQSIIVLPSSIAAFMQGNQFAQDLSFVLRPGGPVYLILYTLIIIFFTYFYTAIVFNPMGAKLPRSVWLSPPTMTSTPVSMLA